MFKVLKSTLLAGALLAAPAWAEEEKEDEGLPFDINARIEQPAAAPQVLNAKSRAGMSLNGKWNIIIDETGMGEVGFFRAAYYALGAPVGPMELVEASFDGAVQLSVPGDWNSQSEELFRYHDTIWYQRNVEVDKKRGKRYFLHFGGVNYKARGYLNGEAIGEHEGGYVAFNFEVTEQLKDGDNNFTINVNGHLDETTVPTFATSDFWKFGGITRDVNLIEVPDTFIRQHHIYLADREAGLIKGWVQLDG